MALVRGAALLTLLALPAALAQDTTPEELAPFDDRLVTEIRFEGIDEAPLGLIENQLRTTVGRPFRATTVTEDIRRLYRTGRFYRVDARVEPQPDASVVVIYELDEAPIIVDVEAVGNRRVSRDELAGIIDLLRGTPVDEFQLGRARRAIEELYRKKGHYQARVTVDPEQLEQGVVLFRIREGQRVRVTRLRFRGNDSFSARKLRSAVKTKTAGLLEDAPLDEDLLARDIVSLANYYRDRAYLDVRADREIIPSPDGKEAIVTFILEEGPRYTLRDVIIDAVDDDAQEALSRAQTIGLMSIKPGDVYGASDLRDSVRAVQQAYWTMGFPEARVIPEELRAVDAPEVDLRLRVQMGERVRTGEVIIQGNRITQQKVIRREITLRPDRPLDRNALRESEQRLDATRLFRQPTPQAPDSGVRVTVLPEDPATPGYRDVLFEVDETNTGSVNFGAAVSSDSGVVGTVSLTQRNFDVTDTPKSFEEFFSGRAFRGGGQDFALTLAPGFELQTYSISLTEPRLFETDYSLGLSGFWRDRRFDDYDERRLGFRSRLGRRFGERWSGGMSFRIENIELSDIDSDAPVDVFEAEGPDTILGVGLSLVRTTVPTGERLQPSRGARTELTFEQVFGDFDFSKLGAEHTVWFTLREDYLERRTTVALRASANYIPQEGEAPVYERYYLGGRSFRGFDFRGVSPRGVRADTGALGDDPIGGDWSFFLGAELQHPLWGNVNGRAVLSGVLFVDSGTVTDDLGFDDYRVSVGFGVRILLPISPIPLALDFGFPLVKEDFDDRELFSFSIDLPF